MHKLPAPVRRRLTGLALIALALGGAAPAACAIDLLESYQAALRGNAELLAARAAAEAGSEARAIAQAQLLPSASLNWSHYRNDLSTRTPVSGIEVDNQQRYTSRSGALVLRQPLYRPAAWAGYRRSESMVVQAEATLAQAGQETGLKAAQA